MREKPCIPSNRHLISAGELNKEEILNVFTLMKMLKDADKQGIRLPLLKDKVLGMMFEITSTRTRISFETAMTQLGGHAEFLEMKTLHVGENHETMRDTAEVISRMVDGVLLRCESQEAMDLFVNHSFVPVFNGMTMDFHPTQAYADIFTMIEHLPEKKIEDITIMYMGDTNHDYMGLVPIQRSLSQMAAILGMTFICCSPEEMMMCDSDTKIFNELAKDSGAKLIKTTDPYEYIESVDFTVSDSFWMGFPEESDEAQMRKGLLYPKYQVNKALLDKAPKHIGVLHCLPGMRDEEITNEVWDGPNSLLFEESENRLHAQKALLTWFMYGQDKSQILKDYHMGKVQSFLHSVK